MDKNCHKLSLISKTSNNVDMKLGPVTKINKRHTIMSKKLMMMSCQQIMTSFFFS